MNLKVLARLTALAAVILIITGLNVTSFSQQSRPRYNQRSNSGGGWTLPPDTIITMRMDQTLNSKTSRVGDRFTASVTEPVQANGRVVIPAGTIVEGRVTQVTPAKRMSKAGAIAMNFDSIIMPDGRRLALVGSLTSDDPEVRRRINDENSVRGPRSDRKAVFVGGSGAIGAVLGGILGGGKGAVVGGVAGAGVGIAGVLLSKGEEAEVRAGTPFGIQLRQPLSMRGDPNYDNSPGDYNSRDNNSREMIILARVRPDRARTATRGLITTALVAERLSLETILTGNLNPNLESRTRMMFPRSLRASRHVTQSRSEELNRAQNLSRQSATPSLSRCR